MVIRQGEIYWMDPGDPLGSAPGFRRPYVVIQNNAMNQTNVRTVIVCALTTNPRRASAHGNVSLEVGEGGLPKQSIVNVSQVFTIGKEYLVERIGTLSRARVRQILDGLLLFTEPREV